MARIRIPCLVGKTNQGGITSWYWQPSATLAKAGWKPLTLGKDEGAAIAAARARNAEVEAWKLGGEKPTEIRTRVLTGTVNALIARYRKEVIAGTKPNGAPILKPRTIADYETGLARLEAWAGKHPLAFVTPARVRALRNATAIPVAQGGIGHAPALKLLKTGRQLFAFAERVDLIARGSNPFTDFELGNVPARRTVWELDDDAAFDAAAYDLGLPGLALARELALFSAQRTGDLLAFTEAQFRQLEIFDRRTRELLAGEGGTVRGWILTQTKTSDEYVSVDMEIPFEPKLADRVEAAIRANRARDRAATPPRLQTFVLVDEREESGRQYQQWKQRDFIKAWTRVLAHAAERTGRQHMTDLQWHDLRRTRVVRLRRRGMPKEMIATITGHSLQSIEMMLRVYGPVDPSMTANAIASTLEPREAEPAAENTKQA